MNTLDGGCDELSSMVRAQQHLVSNMNHTTLHHATDHGANKWNRVRLIDLEMERLIGFVFRQGRQDIQEVAH